MYCILPQILGYANRGSHFPCHGKWGAVGLGKAWQSCLQEEVQYMRVHSPVVGVYGPSLTCKHWGFSPPPVGFVALQVEAPSDHNSGLLQSLVPVGH